MVASERTTTATPNGDMHLFTVDEYIKMIEVGILTEDDRVELIEGVIRNMSPIGSLHADLVDELLELLMNSLGAQCRFRVQSPIHLVSDNMPQPDLTLLKRHKDYKPSHPQAADIFIVIEVSDSTLDIDRNEKMRLYAASDIPEYWIVDVAGKMIEQYTQPTSDGYKQKAILKAGDMLKTAQFADFSLSVNQLFRINQSNTSSS